MFVSLAVTSASSAPALAATPVTVTFSTPGEQGFVIPAGVRSIDVVAIGGRGGDGQGASGASSRGGSPAGVTGTLAVQPGASYVISVGANGTAGPFASAPEPTIGGGGRPGARGFMGTDGGAGGGASDLRTVGGSTAAAFASRLLVAGGGGGAGASGVGGSSGGGAAGARGGEGAATTNGGGGAGTAAAGGAAGATIGENAVQATPGASGAGGRGAFDSSGGGGGGGGGGWFGGGGGGNGAFSGDSSGAGGGGGSSHLASAITAGRVAAATTGVPSVSISYVLAPSATLVPAGLSFPATAPGATSPSQSVTVRNDGAEALVVSGIELGGTHPGDFAADSACAGPVAPGASCTVFARFAPTAGGTRSASLTVRSNAEPAAIVLVGAGTAAGPAVTPRPTATPPAAAPRLSGLRLRPTRFVRSGRGTAISYISSTAGVTTLTVFRQSPGRRVGARCLPPRRKAAPGSRPRACTRSVAVGTLVRNTIAGTNRLTLRPRLNGRVLPAGRYRLQLVTRTPNAVSAAVSAAFTLTA